MATMQWSRLRRNVEALFADSVRGRVRLHSTRYRTTHDEDGRSWITLDGKELVNMVHLFRFREEAAIRAEERAGAGASREELLAQRDAFEHELREENYFMQSDLGHAMHDYQSLSATQALASPNPIIRALAMLDRRVGRRRLRAIDVTDEHPLVRALHQFRCTAEGL